MKLGRVVTAMVTPFDVNQEVDYEATATLVNHLINNGTDALVISGTTGESPTLAPEEKLKLFQHVLQIVDGKVPVVAGTGSNNTSDSIKLTKQAEKVGVDGVLLPTPSYNKPSQEGMYQHFKAIAAATTLPVMLYNIPGRTAVNMNAETIAALSKIDNITAIKEASGDLNQMTAIIEQTEDDFILYSGDDDITLPVLSIGGEGVISVASHINGNEIKQMIDHFVNGNVIEAAAIHRKLLPTMETLFKAPSPAPIKAALNAKGIPVGGVRLPLVSLTTEEINEWWNNNSS